MSGKTAFRIWALRVVTYGVALHGLLIIAGTFEDQVHIRFSRHVVHVSGLVVGIPLFVGLTLLYLSLLLRRRKRTAWLVTMIVYGAIVAGGVLRLLATHHTHNLFTLGDMLLALLMVFGLWWFRREFTVKSDVRSFAFSLRFIALVLAVAFVYGVSGFLLMDKHDFHEQISLGSAIHRTLDQFDLTTTHSLTPYTRRAKLFMDSLSVISLGAVGYAVVSLFQPIRARLVSEQHQRELAADILKQYNGSSEDFFKLWPHDKLYFFNLAHTAGVAYTVRRGVALAVGDPFGRRDDFGALLASFEDYCRANDWTIALIHTEPRYSELYKARDFSLQKIGEEAVLDLAHFSAEIKRGKYFRQIRNKFEKQGYTSEVLLPPHNTAVLSRLRTISDDWLAQPGRTERRLLMGYYSDEYMQICPVMVLRDAAGTIQAFINQVDSCDPAEANFDLLRHTHQALGNANDFLLMEFIEYVAARGFQRLNLGLCPLAGLDTRDEERSVVDSAMRFLYANGDRFYSFSGLHRFKAKYDPAWSGRYIAYRGGVRGFTRVITALNKAMKV
ncbi:MAG TPA: phosphatidylglycerol lysyltransferase domain-containing protein [Candidatus Saccharimonadales bacterium]|nr:phosphatidylglycerol lysyltransferase domain-containing protein [Candidatus Saccharimonadales bacterium]